MRKSLLLASLFVSSFGFAQITKTYKGNGNSNFGGAVGGGKLAITDSADEIRFTFTKGPGTFDSVLVFFLDGRDGGISNTSILKLSNSGDLYQRATAAINPANPTQRATLDFSNTDFRPDGAIVFNKDGGKLFGFLSVPFVGIAIGELNAFPITPSGNNAAPTYTYAAKKSDLGIDGIPNFKFFGTYVDSKGSRSNEGFGDPFTNYLRVARTAGYAPYAITSYLTFNSAEPAALPVKLTHFKAASEGTTVRIDWSVAEESSIEKYEVQRSADGLTFKGIGNVAARNQAGGTSYNLQDRNPDAPGNFYRLAIFENGKVTYSKVALVHGSGKQSSFTAVAQTGNVLNLLLKNIDAGTYQLVVLNSAGQPVKSTTLKHDGVDQSRQFELGAALSKGVYRVLLQSSEDRYVASVLIK